MRCSISAAHPGRRCARCGMHSAEKAKDRGLGNFVRPAARRSRIVQPQQRGRHGIQMHRCRLIARCRGGHSRQHRRKATVFFTISWSVRACLKRHATPLNDGRPQRVPAEICAAPERRTVRAMNMGASHLLAQRMQRRYTGGRCPVVFTIDLMLTNSHSSCRDLRISKDCAPHGTNGNAADRQHDRLIDRMGLFPAPRRPRPPHRLSACCNR